MDRQTWACLCGFQSDHPGTCPTCKEEMYRVGDAWATSTPTETETSA